MLLATLRNIFSHKLRLFATSLSVVLGVAFITGALILTTTAGKVFDDLFANAYAHVDVAVRGPMPVGDVQGAEQPRPVIDQSLMDAVRTVPGVESVSGSIIEYAQVLDKNNKPVGNPSQGAPTLGASWWTDERVNPFQITDGVAPRTDGEVVLDRGTAKKAGYGVGESVRVVTNNGVYPFVVSGIAKFGSVDNPGGASFVLMTMEQAQKTMAGAGKLDSIGVVAQPGVSQQQLRDRVAAALPAGVEVITGKAMIKEFQDQMHSAMKFFNWFLSAFGIIALFVGAFIINNTFSILIAQRQRQSALLRMLGASRVQIVLSILGEAFVVGLLAAGVGYAFGIVMAFGLEALLSAFGMEFPSNGLVLTLRVGVIAVLTGVLVSVVAAVLPALRGGRVRPLVVLRSAGTENRGRPLLRTVVGVAVSVTGVALLCGGLFGDVARPIRLVSPAVGVIFLGVAILGPNLVRAAAVSIGKPIVAIAGVTGRIAQQNMRRNPVRSAKTASALVIGVTLVTFISVFGASMKSSVNSIVDKAFVGDYMISTPQTSIGGMPTSFVDTVRALPEVAAASPIRVTASRVDGSSRYVTAIDPTTFPKVLNVDLIAGSLNALDTKSLAVSDRVASAKHLTVGSYVSMEFGRNGVQQFRVASIFDRNTFGDYLISLPAYDANSTASFDTFVLVNKKSSISDGVAKSALEEAAKAVPTATVQDHTEFKKDYAKQIDQLLNLVYALLALAVLIALLGISNTLMLSLLERTQEIGLLRAVGMLRSQVRAMTRWESLIITLMGSAQGLVIGVFFGWVMRRALVDEGFEVFAIPAPRLLVITVVAAIAGVIAAMLPARRAARMDVLEAIATT